jgi:hypothetical protein
MYNEGGQNRAFLGRSCLEVLSQSYNAGAVKVLDILYDGLFRVQDEAADQKLVETHQLLAFALALKVSRNRNATVL